MDSKSFNFFALIFVFACRIASNTLARAFSEIPIHIYLLNSSEVQSETMNIPAVCVKWKRYISAMFAV